MNNAKTFLEKRYNEDIGIEDAIHTALLTLKEGFEGQVRSGGWGDNRADKAGLTKSAVGVSSEGPQRG